MKTSDRTASTPSTPSTPSQAPGSWLGNQAAAQRALQRALPGIEPQVADPEVCGSGFLHIVIMDPALAPGEVGFQEAILAEHSVGDRDRWDADYAAFARAKARLSWTSGLDGHAVQARMPHRLREGDTLLWGGICLDGIAIGVSGAHPWYDEAFALTVAGWFRAEIKRAAAQATTRGALFAGPPR
jgi:hypothetical protein